MPNEIKNDNQETVTRNESLNYINPVQNMAVDVFMIYQEYWKTQQRATLEYWTQVLQNAYNPWNIK
jgi:hypothetical protein